MPISASYVHRLTARRALNTSLASGPHLQSSVLRCCQFGNAVSRSYASATTASAPLNRPSFLGRFARTVGLAIVFIPAGFIMATVPVAPAINGLLNPPTDAETVNMFEPYDERSAAIDAHILQHPIAVALRGDPTFTESRPFMKLPREAQQHHLTSGALGGAGKLWVPPVVFAQAGGESLATLLYLGRDVCGHPGIVHGGMLATLLDEGLARCCFAALPHKVGMTASLTVDYKAPVPADTYVVLRAHTTKVEGRKAWVEGRIESLDVEEGKEPTVFVTAKGLFVEPKQAATMARLYPAAAG